MMKNLFPRIWPRILVLAAIVTCISDGQVWAGGEAADGNYDFPFPLPNSSIPVPSFAVEPNEPGLMPKLTEGSFQGNIIKKITVSGSTIYSAEELEKITAPYLGKPLGAQADKQTLDEAAQAITDRYRKDGYFLSYASVPVQTVADGTYRLEVTEGYVSEVVLEGEVGPVYALLQSYLAQIPEKRPLNLRDAERYLQLARDVPGISLSSVFRRATGVSGGRELRVKVERRTYGGMVNFDNRGTLIIGPGQALGRIYTDSNTFMGEHLELLYSNSFDAQHFKFTGPRNALDAQHYIAVATSAQIGNDGLQIQLGGAYAQARPGGPLNPDGTPDLNYLTTVGYKIRNQSINTGLFYPIIRGSSLNLGALMQFTLS
ncbi:MAG: hypothetical protein ORN98_09120, partial [Alphaproteobacteria bacterium]|nr:hypothetical protein [Alphaproteobacteria bacterium]